MEVFGEPQTAVRSGFARRRLQSAAPGFAYSCNKVALKMAHMPLGSPALICPQDSARYRFAATRIAEMSSWGVAGFFKIATCGQFFDKAPLSAFPV